MSSQIDHIERTRKTRKAPVSDDWTEDHSSLREWVLKRNKHHLDVMQYFVDRPNDLLVINFIRDPEATIKIAKFLNAKVLPTKPHSNKNRKPKAKDRHSGLISTCLTSMNIPESEWSSDLICSSLLPDNVESENLIFDTSELR